jgi:hypothetical protein
LKVGLSAFTIIISEFKRRWSVSHSKALSGYKDCFPIGRIPESFIMCTKLPLEIWMAISKEIACGDLSRLSRSSTYFLSTLRPLLYRDLVLVSFNSYCFPSTISLLSSNTVLAGCIKTLYIFHHSSGTPIPGLLDAILGMTSLVSLDLNCVLFSDAGEQQRFAAGVRSSRIPLQHLVVHYAVKLPGRDFSLEGLSSLKWKWLPPSCGEISCFQMRKLSLILSCR